MRKMNYIKSKITASILIVLMVLGILIPEEAVFANKTMTVAFPESTQQNRNQTITISGLTNINSVTVDTGNVSYSVRGNNVTINVSNSPPTRTETLSQSAASSQTNATNSFPATILYNNGGYSGTLSKNGSSVYGVLSGSYTPAASKTVTDSRTSSTNSFSSTISYSSGGYSGTLNKSGSSYVSSGSYTPADSKTVTQSSFNFTVEDWCNWDGRQMNYQYDTGYPASTISYNSGGYSGTLRLVWTETSGTLTNYAYYDWDRRQGLGVPSGPYNTKHHYMTGYYTGTVNRPASDTRQYTQNYSGTVTKPAVDTRVWGYTQNYSGTVYKTTNYYTYNVNLDYSIIPTVSTVTVAGSRHKNEDVTLSATGTNIANAAYKIYYTTDTTAPPISDPLDSDWIDSNITGNMNVSSSTSTSVTVPGANLSDTSWKYVFFKVAVSSSTDNWAYKYSEAYSLADSPYTLNDPISYIGHNQIIRSQVATSPTTAALGYNVNTIKAFNVHAGDDKIIYRLEFNLDSPSNVKGLKLKLNLNSANEDGIQLKLDDTSGMKLLSLTGTDYKTITPIKTFNSSAFIQSGEGNNVYTLTIGASDIPTAAGRYAVEYIGNLSVDYTSEITPATITNEAELSYDMTGSGAWRILQPEAPNRKMYINTLVTRKYIKYR